MPPSATWAMFGVRNSCLLCRAHSHGSILCSAWGALGRCCCHRLPRGLHRSFGSGGSPSWKFRTNSNPSCGKKAVSVTHEPPGTQGVRVPPTCGSNHVRRPVRKNIAERVLVRFLKPLALQGLRSALVPAALAACGRSGVGCFASATGSNARRSARFDAGHLTRAATKQATPCRRNQWGDVCQLLKARPVCRRAARGTSATGC
jgi:hypothetical protein